MSSTSDLSLDSKKFQPSSVNEDIKELNKMLKEITLAGPKWHEVGIAKYRELREAGKTQLPTPPQLPNGKDASIPSREQGRDIPLRLYLPDNGQPSKGVLLHFHGGGFIIGSAKNSDLVLQRWANECQLTTISVEYRLAPEHPHPAAVHDCFDAAEYILEHAEGNYGAKLLFLCGESAGGTLTAQTAFHILRKRPEHQLAGVVIPYGWFDLTLNLPQASSFKKPLVLNTEALQRFADAYVPGKNLSEKRDPLVSPLYEDMQGLVAAGKLLPPALFVCGTEDALLDDTLLMSVKWLSTGSEAIVKIYPGAPHAFYAFPSIKASGEASAAIIHFINEKLERLA